MYQNDKIYLKYFIIVLFQKVLYKYAKSLLGGVFYLVRLGFIFGIFEVSTTMKSNQFLSS